MKSKILILALLCSMPAWAQRMTKNLTEWQFSRDSLHWQNVVIPHDWAISGPFDKKWDLQCVAIEQNGETEATEKSGRSGALPWIGKGYYRTIVTVPDGYDAAELLFDGAMSEPVVKVNGKVAGEWKYGYNAFRVDISDFLRTQSTPRELTIEVDLQNVEESSRWYPGAGLYRPVTLIATSKAARIDDWGIMTQTTDIHLDKKDMAKLKVEVPIANYQKGMCIGLALLDADGKSLTQMTPAPMRDGKAQTTFMISNAKLWTPETPYLYKVRAALYDGKGNPSLWDDMGNIIDEKTINVGLRTIKVSKEGGFELNGVSRKLQGVCLHHDLGPLGAALDRAAVIRQIRILKDMGCDAIRTSHNMPSTMQMEVCDSMGMMVMAESFDMWIYPKCKNGYSRFFKEWALKDITNLVLNHRNHPSIVMWSIGNEIPEQWDADAGVYWAKKLQDTIHELDPTRPVTQGMDHAEDALKSGFAQVMDIPGFNYHLDKYEKNMEKLTTGFLLGSETASTVSSRGVYKFPVELSDYSQYASYSPNYDSSVAKTGDGQCSSYDVQWCPWSNLPDDDFMVIDDRSYTIGQFVWTGFDYLGEPTPYDEYWPARSSYFGICDLAGLPKDRYWLYRSQWNKQDHTLHILPHWNWTGREGQVTPVYVYTDYPEAELFLNGKSQGRIKKNPDVHTLIAPIPTVNGKQSTVNSSLLDRYRLRWNDVVYEPGELKVVAYDAAGNAVQEAMVATAGEPADLQLDIEPIEGDLAFVKVSLVDEKGIFVPTASDNLIFEVTGEGSFKAVCNGDATSLEVFTEPHMHLFSGELVVVVKLGKTSGATKLTVRCPERNIVKTITL